MTQSAPIDQSLPDTEVSFLLRMLPAAARPFALLARFDRPIGWWLLFWPCLWGLALGGAIARWDLVLWFLLGSIVMRGAGCVYNDIIDRDLDAKVTRTAARPIPSGAVSITSAWIWLIMLCLIGLIVLLQLGWQAQLIALGSLALVAAYPFMKRITWWPQAWLGMVFSWGALVAWVEADAVPFAAGLWLYAGSIAWVIGYDTIYALQDREDDGLVGIRSSALAMGTYVSRGVALFYALALAGWAMAIWTLRPQLLPLAGLIPVALHLIWQVATLKQDGADPLIKFRSNRYAGFLAALAFLVVGQTV
jgi:4-hydroxybenzoate polyprenyltransferase